MGWSSFCIRGVTVHKPFERGSPGTHYMEEQARPGLGGFTSARPAPSRGPIGQVSWPALPRAQRLVGCTDCQQPCPRTLSLQLCLPFSPQTKVLSTCAACSGGPCGRGQHLLGAGTQHDGAMLSLLALVISLVASAVGAAALPLLARPSLSLGIGQPPLLSPPSQPTAHLLLGQSA